MSILKNRKQKVSSNITWLCEDNETNIEQFSLPNNYKLIKFLGKGTYGYVVKVVVKDKDNNNNNSEILAIKKCKDVFSSRSTVKRLLREIKILRLVDHPNIVKIKSILLPEEKEFQDVLICFEPLDYDLSKLIASNHEIEEVLIKHLARQLFEAIFYIHSHCIIHRDIKSKNILLFSNGILKLGDFGLATTAHSNNNIVVKQTDNVVTRYYRAPEIFMAYDQEYSYPIDIWSAGCVLAEFVLRRTLFSGSDSYDMLAQIINLVGRKPTEEYLKRCRKEKRVEFIQRLASIKTETNRLEDLFKNENMCNLVKGCLTFESETRLNAFDALTHSFFGNKEFIETVKYSQPTSSTISITISEFEKKFSKVFGINAYRSFILRDINMFHHNSIEEEEDLGYDTTTYSTTESFKTCRSTFFVNRIEDKIPKCTVC